MTSLLTALLGRLPLGWLQLMRNRTRLVAAVGGVAFANVLIFMQLGFMNALFETSVIAHRGFSTDLVLTGSDFATLREVSPLPRVRMHQALGVPGVASATPVSFGTLSWLDPESLDTSSFRVIGVDPTADVFLDEVLQSQLVDLRVADTAILDRLTRGLDPARATAIEGGDTFVIEAAGRQLRIDGLFAQGASFDVDGTVVVSDQTFLRLFPSRSAGTPTLALLTLDEGADPVATRDRIHARLASDDVRAWTKDGFIAAEQAYQSQQSPIGFVFGFGVAIGLVVGLVIVYQVLATDVQDHLGEYATFKAIGYRPRFFLSIVFEEAVCLALLGFVPGLSISLGLYAIASSATALPIAMTPGRLALVLTLTVAMCAASGAIATRRLRSADPAELF